MTRSLFSLVAIPLFSAATFGQSLLIDFNSTTQDGGPHNQAGYQPYDAGHEVQTDFIRQTYTAFGTNVGITPEWPDTTDNRVEQMIDRGAGNDANWVGDKLDLLTDFLGIDTRTANGGNGDLASGANPTSMLLTLDGLPAGPYTWVSYHHDTEHVWASFFLEVSTDGGASFSAVADATGGTLFTMTDSTPAGSPASPITYDGSAPFGPDPLLLPSTIITSFNATGDDVVLRFTPFSESTGVHRQIFGINGFELYAVPEPASAALLGLGALLALALRRR